jgi:hypothetical protein
LDEKWKNDNSYGLLKNNCSHMVGNLLEELGLLNSPNPVVQKEIRYPKSGLLEEHLLPSSEWECTEVGYLSLTPGESLWDSWQANKPTRREVRAAARQ